VDGVKQKWRRRTYGDVENALIRGNILRGFLLIELPKINGSATAP